MDAETLRRWMLAEGLWSRERKRRQHRRRRERKEHFGELLQLDGSFEEWLPASGQKQCLMNLVDDATSRTLSQLHEQETTWAAAAVLRAWIERYGVPHCLYTDCTDWRIEQERVISQDWVVQYQGRWLQIERESRYAPAGGKVTVSEGPDGGLAIAYRGRRVSWQEIPRPTPRPPAHPPAKAPGIEVRKTGQPAASHHPWKKWRPGWLQGKAARSAAGGALSELRESRNNVGFPSAPTAQMGTQNQREHF